MFQEYREALGNNNVTVFVPDSWQIKVPQFRPQLAIGWGEIIGNKAGPIKWTSRLPRYWKETPSPPPEIPDYHKGNIWCQYDLLDGSKIIVNALNEQEGKRLISDLIKYVNPQYVSQPFNLDDISWGKRKGKPLREVKVRAVSAAYLARPLEDNNGFFSPKLEAKWTITL